ncbi:hypothetical protein [Aeromicrobium massiliense]|uniref:hypothetical protein n=1 Tax=Aeromicrobium massiliense TaxID=1464554 RepID=UPI0002DC2386|nr:hypothetical protein [Aeromicrobium massiliense]
MKTLKTAAAVVLASVVLTACGGNDTGAYCDRLEKAEDDFSSVGQDGNMSDAFDTFRELRDEAPDAVKDDWETLTGAIEEMEKAYEDAGIDLDKVDELDASKLSQEQVAKLSEATKKLGNKDYTDASNNISEHAKSECDIDLGASS